MITIEKEKCIGCGQCVPVCPNTVIVINEEKKAQTNAHHCLECMHCAAICPQEAITFDQEAAVAEPTKELTEEIKDHLETIVKQRRSYRRFQEKQVPREDVKRWLEIADLVPSAKNQHPIHWIVIDSAEIREKLMGPILDFIKENNVSTEILTQLEYDNNPVIGQNASLLIGYCDQSAINGFSDTAIALTTIELLMQAEQVGTCWGGYLMRFLNQIPECRALVGLPEGATVYGTLMFGYPKQQEYRHVPVRRNKAEITFV